MKREWLIVASLLFGALLATILLVEPGYVAIAAQGYVLTLSIPLFILLWITTYFLLRLCIRLLRARRTLVAAKITKTRERAQQKLVQGLLELSAGQWASAEKTLTRAAPEAAAPVVYYLAAARAAELQGNSQHRDEWLAHALDADPQQRTAVLITQAEMYLRRNQLKAALTTLEQLGTDQNNVRGLELLARVYRQLGDWQQLSALEPRLRTATEIDRFMIDDLVAQIYLERLKTCNNQNARAQLQALWQDLPKSLLYRPDIIVAYARAALSCHEPNGEQALRDLLDTQWDETAILIYGEFEHTDPLDALIVAENWLAQRPDDAALLYTCARLCLRAELYGKARHYLETSLALRPRLEAAQLLAHLYEQAGDTALAMKTLNTALTVAIGKKTTMPRVRALRSSQQRYRQHHDER